MLSRITESLYWIGRYVERAEDTARITNVNFHHTLGMGTSPDAELRHRRMWEALVSIVGDEARFAASYPEANEETIPIYLTFDQTNPNSVISCIAKAREQAHTMRHQIASEMWEALNRFHLDLQRQRSFAQPVGIENAHLFYRSVTEFSHFFQGITDSTMPREEGWYFLQTGKFLERAEKTARTLDIKYHLLMTDAIGNDSPDRSSSQLQEGVPGDWHEWIAVLRSLSAYEAYHKLYRSSVQPRAVIEMLTFSPVFPRSIRFSIEQVQASLEQIAAYRAYDPATVRFETIQHAAAQLGSADEAERAVGRLQARLAYGSTDEMFDESLHLYLSDVQRRCNQIGEHIQARYFAPRILRMGEVIR